MFPSHAPKSCERGLQPMTTARLRGLPLADSASARLASILRASVPGTRGDRRARGTLHSIHSFIPFWSILIIDLTGGRQFLNWNRVAAPVRSPQRCAPSPRRQYINPPAPPSRHSPPSGAAASGLRLAARGLRSVHGRWRRGLAHSAHNRGDGGSNPQRPNQLPSGAVASVRGS